MTLLPFAINGKGAKPPPTTWLGTASLSPSPPACDNSSWLDFGGFIRMRASSVLCTQPTSGCDVLGRWVAAQFSGEKRRRTRRRGAFGKGSFLLQLSAAVALAQAWPPPASGPESERATAGQGPPRPNAVGWVRERHLGPSPPLSLTAAWGDGGGGGAIGRFQAGSLCRGAHREWKSTRGVASSAPGLLAHQLCGCLAELRPRRQTPRFVGALALLKRFWGTRLPSRLLAFQLCISFWVCCCFPIRGAADKGWVFFRGGGAAFDAKLEGEVAEQLLGGRLNSDLLAWVIGSNWI